MPKATTRAFTFVCGPDDFLVNRVGKERFDSLPDDPELLCGAALLLDAPSPAYRSRMLKRREGPLAEAFRDILPPVEFDDQAIIQAEEVFQQRTTARCLDLLQSATTLAPEDRDLWRTRALLLFNGFMTPRTWEPRDSDWASVLEEAQRHDPDNALYDLIAAMHLLRASADLDLHPEAPKVTVRNRLLMEDGVRRLEMGLSRPKLQTGTSRARAVWRFLSTARAAGVHPYKLGVLDEFDGRMVFLLRELVRWERGLADLALIEERPEDATRGLDLLRRMPRQWEEREGNDFTYAKLVPLYRQIIVANIEIVSQAMSESDLKWNAEQLAVELDGAKQELARMDARGDRVRYPPDQLERTWPVLASLLAAFTPVFVLPCVVVGTVLLGFQWWLCSDSNAPPMAPLSMRSSILHWSGGFLLTAGLTWLGTFWKGSPKASALDDFVRDTWGRGALAFIAFLRGPLGWNILAATLGLLLVSTMWRHARSNGAGWSRVAGEKRSWGAAFARDGARLSLGTAVMLLFFHVACFPSQVTAVDALDRQWQAWAADPQARWAAWDAALAAVP